MSYAEMDHAAWVQSNNNAMRKQKGKPKTDNFGRAIGPKSAPEVLTEFQTTVMDILGIVYGGIYNAPINWDTVDWNAGGGVSVVVSAGGGFSTYDFNRLTTLVFLCHESRVRMDLSSAGMRHWRLTFWQRSHEGGISNRHPNLDEAIATFREYVPADHRVMYRPTQGNG